MLANKRNSSPDVNNDSLDNGTKKSTLHLKQIEIIRGFLKNAFGNYSIHINVTNRLLIYIGNFIKACNDVIFYNGDKNSLEYQELIDVVTNRGNMIKGYIIDTFPKLLDEMEKEFDEFEIKKALDKFLKGIKDRIRPKRLD